MDETKKTYQCRIFENWSIDVSSLQFQQFLYRRTRHHQIEYLKNNSSKILTYENLTGKSQLTSVKRKSTYSSLIEGFLISNQI